MAERLLSVDPLTGISTFHDYDEDTDQTIIRYTGDCEPTLEANKARANDAEFSADGIRSDMWLFASIPAALQCKWLIEEGLDVYKKEHSDRLFRKLNDPAYKYLKCTTGRHIVK